MSITLAWTFSIIFPKLGWYSTPYQLGYYLIVQDKNGNESVIQGKDMAPFDIFFTFSRWDVLDKNQLPRASENPEEIKRSYLTYPLMN